MLQLAQQGLPMGQCITTDALQPARRSKKPIIQDLLEEGAVLVHMEHEPMNHEPPCMDTWDIEKKKRWLVHITLHPHSVGAT